MIEKITVNDFLAFKRELHIDFCKGANIFIGENGTGKTTLLKILYAHCKEVSFKQVFHSTNFNLFNREIPGVYIKPCKTDIISAVFIPTTEMLSHTRGFPEHYDKYNLPFDDTQIDIIKNARLNETRQLTPLAEKLLPIVSEVIDGEVVYENDTFYVVKNNGMKLEFSLEAEGLRKFGLLWKLLRNGLFDEPGTILFWDEPEANLNPMLIPTLVDILLELQRSGVQMFITTHEYNLARYFDLKRGNKEDVMFHNLYKKEDGYIYCDSSFIYQDLDDKAIEKADGELGDFIIEKALEELDNV